MKRVSASTPVNNFYLAAAYFAQVDNNSDGLISFEEASSFLGEHPVVRRDVGRETPEWFSKIDVDRNGFISPAEFDSKLA